MAATDLYLIRKNQQWVKFSAVTDVTVTGPTTTDEIEVWSGEYRDIFSTSISLAGASLPSTYSAPGMVSNLLARTENFIGNPGTPGAVTVGTYEVTPTASASVSDETAHEPLRQTALKRTCWKFDYGVAATPRYGYAFVMDGDIVSNNPPETV
jgi:hypothetical protein